MKVNKHMHMPMRPSLEWFSPFREEILRVWSRINLEGQCFAWTYFSAHPSNSEEGILGFLHAGEYGNWTEEAKALWEGSIWRR